MRTLENGGAKTIVLACITAHCFYDKLEETVTTAKLFHMVRETAAYVSEQHPNPKKVGLLATEGTLKMGLWQKEFGVRGIRTLVLPGPLQKKYFNEVVYGRNGIKAGYRGGDLKNVLLTGCGELIDRGAEAIVGACSELPLAISDEDLPVPYIDPIQITVQKLLALYYGDVRY